MAAGGIDAFLMELAVSREPLVGRVGSLADSSVDNRPLTL
jgi:hypothetical protein